MRALLLGLLLLPSALTAQLASPGPLARVHAELEGVRSCTRCHALRQRGIEPARCLSCHTPLRQRIAQRRGYHGRLRDTACARCHQEHIGANADIVRFDSTSFDHRETGWVLRGAHRDAKCRSCHDAANITAADVRAYRADAVFLAGTYLGAATRCAACHLRESPHEAAVNRRACSDCHDEQDWHEVERFDHASTKYPLTGAHRAVACAGCHGSGRTLRLVGVAHASCRDCHRDPHGERYGNACASCHQTSGWGEVPASRVADRFDHSRTRFPLRGAHARATCAACHDRSRARRAGIRISFVAGSERATFPPPAGRTCSSCHVDYHAGQLSAGTTCERCHGEQHWLPVTFDVSRHQRETRFPLEAAHLVVPCGACHTRSQGDGPPQLHWRDLDCRVCHAARDPHGDMFLGRACGECHRGASFKGATFDHATARGRACGGCHTDDSPHGAQFEQRDCGECHETASYRIAAFDHARTRFPLDGAHARTGCHACHARTADGRVQYRPLPLTCVGCHGGGS